MHNKFDDFMGRLLSILLIFVIISSAVFQCSENGDLYEFVYNTNYEKGLKIGWEKGYSFFISEESYVPARGGLFLILSTLALVIGVTYALRNPLDRIKNSIKNRLIEKRKISHLASIHGNLGVPKEEQLRLYDTFNSSHQKIANNEINVLLKKSQGLIGKSKKQLTIKLKELLRRSEIVKAKSDYQNLIKEK